LHSTSLSTISIESSGLLKVCRRFFLVRLSISGASSLFLNMSVAFSACFSPF
jgi:hypothetical protein